MNICEKRSCLPPVLFDYHTLGSVDIRAEQWYHIRVGQFLSVTIRQQFFTQPPKHFVSHTLGIVRHYNQTVMYNIKYYLFVYFIPWV